MKKFFIYILTISSLQYAIYPQEDNSYLEKKIIMQLYEDNVFKFVDHMGNIIRDFSLLNEVKINYTYMEYESDQYRDFDFYFFELNSDNLTSKNESVSISILKTYPECHNFILAHNINNFSRNIYRLSGFSSNDLIYLLHDISIAEKEGMKTKKIMKEMDNTFKDLDIRCMYESIMKLDFSSGCFKSGCFRKRPYSFSLH